MQWISEVDNNWSVEVSHDDLRSCTSSTGISAMQAADMRFPHADSPPLLSQMSCTVQGKIDSHEMAVCSGSGVPHARWLNVPGTKVMLK